MTNPMQSSEVLDMQFKAVASLFGNHAWVAWRILEDQWTDRVKPKGLLRRPKVVGRDFNRVERTIRPKMLATVSQAGVRTLAFDIPRDHTFDFTGKLLGAHIFAKEDGPWLLFAPFSGSTNIITPGTSVHLPLPLTLTVPREYG